MNHFFELSKSQNEVVISIVLIVLGIAALYLSYRGYKVSKLSVDWPSTTGVILHSKYSASVNSNGAPVYSSNIRYSYKIQDKVYESTRVFFGSALSSTFSSESEKELSMKYKATQDVIVFYNPENPKISVLETGYHSRLNIGFISGAVFILIGILELIFKINIF